MHLTPPTTLHSHRVIAEAFEETVRPGSRRRGIGRRLMEALRTEAAREGITVAFVPADNEDRHALDFYRALGGTAAPVTIFTFDSRCQ